MSCLHRVIASFPVRIGRSRSRTRLPHTINPQLRPLLPGGVFAPPGIQAGGLSIRVGNRGGDKVAAEAWSRIVYAESPAQLRCPATWTEPTSVDNQPHKD